MHYDTPLDSVIETIGMTPLVAVHAGPTGVPIYAKLETFNPGGSVKDRIGKHIIQTLWERGDLEPGDTIIEPTAGNTGIGMAIAAIAYGLDATFVVPRGFSREKEVLMRALGAELVHLPAGAGMRAAVDRADELAAERDDAVVPQQFAAEANVEAHYRTTGREIVDAMGSELGAIVAGIGSGGTIMGVSRAVREAVPDVHVVGVEPCGSTFGTMIGRDRAPSPYKTEGIGTHDPTIAELIDPTALDDIVAVSDRDTHAEVQRLAREEGHLVGSSSAAASVAARRVAEEIADSRIEVPGDTVVTIFPDGSERYLSKHLYGSFAEWEGKHD